MELHIGEKLKTLRNSKNMSIAELAKISGVSTGLISQIERDMVSPSVVNLYKIASALDANISSFFDDVDKKYTVIREGNHTVMLTDNGSKAYQLLSPGDASNTLDLAIIKIKKDERMADSMVSHEGEECGYVLEGTLTVLIEGEKILLKKGDSIHFNSSVPHVFINEKEEECVSVWAMTPKFF